MHDIFVGNYFFGVSFFLVQIINDVIVKLVVYDMFCLEEAHCDFDLCLELQKCYRPVHLIRFKLKQTRKKYDGLSVYAGNAVRPGRTCLNHASDEFISLKLSKDLYRTA